MERQTTVERQIIALQLAGNLLEQVMAVGDVLALGSISKSESPGDDLRLLVIVQPPVGITRQSEESMRFQAVWPKDAAVQELWSARTMECRRGNFICAESLFYVERCGGHLIYLGAAADLDGFLPDAAARIEMELWQSPVALREQLNNDIVTETVSLMETEFRFSASRPNRTGQPINTSPIVAFWQLYLRRLAAGSEGSYSAELVDRWMPSHADEMHVLRLWPTMRKRGWVAIKQIPMIFHQTVRWEQPPQCRSFLEVNPSTADSNILSKDKSSVYDTSFDDRIAEAVDVAMKFGMNA